MEAIGNEVAGVTYAAFGTLTGGEPERDTSTLRPAPLLQDDGDQGGSARFALPMAIFCGMLLSSLSIAIGIGYKRRFDAIDSTADPEYEAAESDPLQ